jgi:hypothetical protein
VYCLVIGGTYHGKDWQSVGNGLCAVPKQNQPSGMPQRAFPTGVGLHQKSQSV